MSSEYSALMNNQTWTFCPRPNNHNVVRNKWISKVKEKLSGSVDRYKAQLVAKVFDQKVKLTAMRPLVQLPNQQQSPQYVFIFVVNFNRCICKLGTLMKKCM